MGRRLPGSVVLLAFLLSGCRHAPMTAVQPDAPTSTVSMTTETVPDAPSSTVCMTSTEGTPEADRTAPDPLTEGSTTVMPPSEGSAAAAPSAGRLAGIKIGLDPGHQAHGDPEQEAVAPGDPRTKDRVTGGAVGVVTGIPEYITVLDIAKCLKEKLEAEGAIVYMTRETHDVDISNQERTKMMNDYGVDLMLRIHCDSASSADAKGVGMFVSRSNAIAQKSYEYAAIMQPIICGAIGAQDRGITQNDEYTGQNWAEVPCIMIECGFLSAPEEDRLLNDADHQDRLAEGICEGIVACFS